MRWPNFAAQQTQAAAFYQANNYALAWTERGAVRSQARAAIRVLESARLKGLDPEDYDGGRWAGRLKSLECGPDAGSLIRFDLALTIGMLRYMSDSSIGRVNPKVFCFGYDVESKRCDLAGVLRLASKSNDVAATLEQIEPRFPAYRRTLDALKRYLALAEAEKTEDLPAPRNAQRDQHLRQLRDSLERWRWIPTEFARPPLMVNIPEFRLRALNEHLETELEMNVVVGRAYRRQTPVFSDEMTHLIFRPYWNVPLSITRQELIPLLAKDGDYLGHNSYEVIDARNNVVESDSVTADMLPLIRSGKLSIRQAPGNKNALGHIKFMFPNEHNVYLHGTPAKSLFARARRDFSHGCIRVEKPQELAEWVLRGKPGWTAERIKKEEHSDGQPLQVNLDQPIPVLIFYATAVVLDDGEIRFYEDIYCHDAALDQLLDHGYPYSDWKPEPQRPAR